MRALILMALLALCGAVGAQQVYRCTDASGKVQLGDRMCDASAVDAARVHVRPNTVDNSEERELRLREENARLREQLQRQQEAGAAAQTGRSAADLQAERSGSYECRQAQRELEVVASSVSSRDSGPQRAAEQRMRAACGMREPTTVNVYNERPGGRALVRQPAPAASGGIYQPKPVP